MLNVTSPHAYPLVICDDAVDEAVCFGLLSAHVIITLGIHLDDAKRLAGVGCQMLIQPFPCGDDVIRYDLDIGRLTLCSAGGLVNHDLCIGQGKTFAPNIILLFNCQTPGRRGKCTHLCECI